MITLTKQTFVGVYCITVLPNGLGQIDHINQMTLTLIFLE